MQDVVQTKLPTTWIRENADFFRTAVNVPFVSELDDDDVQHWVSRAQRDDASYEQLRDATLVDFDSESDILSFMRLMFALNIRVNVSLRGQEYIRNNAYQ